MDDHEIETLERARLRALVDRDVERAMELHAPDYELITPGGGDLHRADHLGAIADGEIRYRRFEPIGDVRVRSYPDSAVVRYRVWIDIDFPGGTESGDYWHTDYWERRDGRWQAVWSHATRIRSADPT